MADPDIIIGLKTKGDTTGADEVKESIFAVEDAAKKVDREMDVLEAKRRNVAASDGAGAGGQGIMGTDVSGGVEALSQKAADYAGFGQQFRAVSRLISADAVAVAGSFVAIGAAAAKSYDMLDETSARWREFETELKARGEELPQEIAGQIAAIEQTIGPVKAVITGVSGALEKMWKTVKDPVGELSGLNDLKKSHQQLADQIKKTDAEHLKVANETAGKLGAYYKEEAAGLKEQEETLKRIGALRGQLQSIEQQRADRQIKIAQQDGGDVALAEVNALAVRLKVEVAALAENLRQSEAGVATTQQAYDSAFSAYNRALTDNVNKLDPDAFAKLSTTLDTASKELQKSQTIANEQGRLFADAKLNVAEDVEVALVDLRDKYKDSMSKKTAAAFKSLEESLKETVATGPAAAIAQIQVEVGTITSAATDKGTEVKAALDGERTNTVQAIKQLAPKQQDTQAVVAAVQEVGRALDAQGNAAIAALAGVSAAVGQITNRLAQQQAQINQIQARVR